MNSVNKAVKFGETVDQGRGPNVAFPFIYTFVPKTADAWDTVKATAPVLSNNMTYLGINVAANGGREQHSIVLDQNYNFKMLGCRFGAFYLNAVSGTYEWWNNETGWRLDWADQYPVGTPLYRYLRISLSLPADSRYLFGGKNVMPTAASPGSLIPLSISAFMGEETGIGQVRTPYLLPQSGQIIFEITNTHPTKALLVYGCVYGMKVRL